MINPFFGGDASTLGTVAALPIEDFPSFVKECLGHAATLPLTRNAFLALPKADRDMAKRVPYVTPAAFAKSPSPRRYEHATVCNLVCQDIDDGAQAAPFVNDPSLLETALEPYAFAAYTTASSTRQQPRLRIMVSARGIPMGDYPRAVNHVATLLGLPAVNKESRVSVQPMYLPTLFKGEQMQPLIASRCDGSPLLLSDIPVDQDSLPRNPPKEGEPFSGEEDISHLRATVDGITLEDCEAALSHLDPDMGYGDWLEVAAALRHQFPHQAEAAYQIFDKWSSQSVLKYGGADDTKLKWKSLRPSPKGRAPVTIRSLLNKAKAAGWGGAEAVSRKAHAAVLAWLQGAHDAHVLINEGIQRIAAASAFVSDVDKAGLLGLLHTNARRQGAKLTLADVKRALRRLEKKPMLHPGKGDSQLPAWARGICYVAGTNEFFQRASDKKFSPEVLDNVHGVNLMSGEPENGRPAVRPRDYLLNLAKIPRVDHYRYDPTQPERTFIADENGRKYVNTYLPTYPDPDPSRAKEAEEVIRAHLQNLIAEPEYQSILLDWLAYQVQHPGKKIRWAVLLQGAEGCGKTALAEMMRQVLGTTNVMLMDAGLLFSQFNEWAAGNQIVAMEEIRIVGHNRHEVMSKLKPCISNDTVTINGKHDKLNHVINLTNYMMFTNHMDSLAVDDGDRRYFVVNSPLQRKEQIEAMGGHKYFDNLFATIHGNAAGVRAWLEGHKLSPEFHPEGRAPRTKYLAELTSAASSPLHSAVRDAIADGEHPLVKTDLVSHRALRALIDLERVPPFSDQALAGVLRELGYDHAARTRMDDGRHTLWVPRGTPSKDFTALAKQRLKGQVPDAEGLTLL